MKLLKVINQLQENYLYAGKESFAPISRHGILWDGVVTLISCIVPLAVIYMGYSGNFWIYDVLGWRIQD